MSDDPHEKVYNTRFIIPYWLNLLIWDIPGVASCCIMNRYKLVVSKGEAFSWDEITPKLDKILKAAASDQDEEVSYSIPTGDGDDEAEIRFATRQRPPGGSK